jgi:hypothetical protein
MEVMMKESTRFFAPLFVVVVFMLAAQWIISTRADAVPSTSAATDSVTVTPFEYFPAKFLMNAPERGEDIPTF